MKTYCVLIDVLEAWQPLGFKDETVAFALFDCFKEAVFPPEAVVFADSHFGANSAAAVMFLFPLGVLSMAKVDEWSSKVPVLPKLSSDLAFKEAQDESLKIFASMQQRASGAQSQ